MEQVADRGELSDAEPLGDGHPPRRHSQSARHVAQGELGHLLPVPQVGRERRVGTEPEHGQVGQARGPLERVEPVAAEHRARLVDLVDREDHDGHSSSRATALAWAHALCTQ